MPVIQPTDAELLEMASQQHVDHRHRYGGREYKKNFCPECDDLVAKLREVRSRALLYAADQVHERIAKQGLTDDVVWGVLEELRKAAEKASQ